MNTGFKTLAALIALATTALATDYPRWRNDGGGAAPDSGEKLVSSWNDARLLWMSEERSARDQFTTRRPGRPFGTGGYANPVLVDGRIYLLYFKPSGMIAEWSTRGEVQKGSARSYINADDIIVCIDAHTGKTIWRTVFKGKGYNHHTHKNYGGHYTACVEDGYVYALGSMGRAYCVDAKTGKPRWDVPTGPQHDAWAYHKEMHLRAKQQLTWFNPGKCRGKKPSDLDKITVDKKPDLIKPKPKSVSEFMEDSIDDDMDFDGSLDKYMFNGAAMVADGVAFFHGGGSCLVAVDCKSGKILWKDGGGMPITSSPYVWRHQGKEYLLTGAGGLTCYEPRTGKKIWTYKKCGGRRGPVVYGDYCFVPDSYGKGSEDCEDESEASAGAEDVCMKLTLDGPKELWRVPLGSAYSCPVLHKGLVWYYYRGFPFPKGSRPGTFAVKGYRDDMASQVMVCLGVDFKTGKVVRHLENAPLKMVGSLAACDDRMVCHSAQAQRCPSPPYGLYLFDINPENPRSLGYHRVLYEYCVSPLMVDGKLYYKTPNHMLGCFDLRADRTAVERDTTPAGCKDDYARYVIDLEDYGYLGKPLRLHLGYHNGAFRQAWATAPPLYNNPMAVRLKKLRLKDGKLTGVCEINLDGPIAANTLTLSVADGCVTGTYKAAEEPVKVGYSIPGKRIAPGVVAAPFDGSGILKMELHHWWLKGCNARYAGAYDGGHLFVDLKDGNICGVRIESEKDMWEAKVHGHKLTYRDNTLAGTVRTTVKSKTSGEPPLPDKEFVLRLDVKRYISLLKGKLTIADGPLPGREFDVTGMASAAGPQPDTFSSASFHFNMGHSIRRDSSMWVSLRSENGKIVEGYAIGNKYGDEWKDYGTQCSSVFPVKVDGLKVDGTSFSGPIRIHIRSDGRIPLIDKMGSYRIEMALADKSLKGKYTGTVRTTHSETRKATGRVVKM